VAYRAFLVAWLLPLVGVSPVVNAESFFDQFKDDDGWFDVGDWVLDNAAGFLPAPILITEPAVGGGLGAAAVFFHAPRNYEKGSSTKDGEFVVPNISAIAGAVTGNDSWFLGGGHFAHWKNDRVRYEGVIGVASINLKFFGFPDGQQFSQGIRFNTEGFFTEHPISFRIGSGRWFAGAGWDYYDLKTEIDLGLGIPGIDPLQLDMRLSGLQLFLQYDSLDNMFTPNSGLEAEITVGRKDESIGSDAEYDLIEASIHSYWQIQDPLVLGFRLETQGVNGDVPFFVLPFVDLRGIAAARYQGEATAVAEAEARWSWHPRLGAVGFIGLGKAANSFSDLADASSLVTKGVGIRYFAARKLGLHVGIDIARGPEETYWYLTFGSAW